MLSRKPYGEIKIISGKYQCTCGGKEFDIHPGVLPWGKAEKVICKRCNTYYIFLKEK